jgi:hypothetical protein
MIADGLAVAYLMGNRLPFAAEFKPLLVLLRAIEFSITTTPFAPSSILLNRSKPSSILWE